MSGNGSKAFLVMGGFLTGIILSMFLSIFALRAFGIPIPASPSGGFILLIVFIMNGAFIGGDFGYSIAKSYVKLQYSKVLKPKYFELVGYATYKNQIGGQWGAVYKVYMENGSILWATIYPGDESCLLSDNPNLMRAMKRPKGFPKFLRPMI